MDHETEKKIIKLLYELLKPFRFFEAFHCTTTFLVQMINGNCTREEKILLANDAINQWEEAIKHYEKEKP